MNYTRKPPNEGTPSIGEHPWEHDKADEPYTLTCNGGASSPVHLRREDLGGESLIRLQLDEARWRLLTSDHAAELVMALLKRIDFKKLSPELKEALLRRIASADMKIERSKDGHVKRLLDYVEGKEE